MLDNQIIAQRLIDARGTENREDVAKACNISVSTLGMYERGERVPRDFIKVALADHYKTTVEALFYATSRHETCQKEG